ncbi:nuclear transport factor 2 family protein [Streptomyces sp. NPDC049881]|uniref:nuclear transport factor 2 family protein n=1 Tax=Streptomyces sp. NPDC049881 TaxID=3155778 RepID=UPI0034256DBF
MPDIPPAALPAPVRHYLDAHRAHDTTTALASFTPDATVTDDGTTHAGTADIAAWLARAYTAHTRTEILSGGHCDDETHCAVTLRLSGDIPGGEVDLAHSFTLRDGLIYTLTIAPA